LWGVSQQFNLARLAEASLERSGDHDSLFFEGRVHRSGELHERSRRLAGGLLRLGVRPGDRVVVSMPNQPEVGVVYGALWRVGAAITPAMFLLTQAEVRHILQDSEAVGIVTSPELLEHVRGAAQGVATVRWIACSGDAAADVVPLGELEQAEAAEIVDVSDDAMAALMYTGGTTGRAKGVVLSHENLWYCGRSSWEAGYEPGINRTLVPLPLAHAFGLIVTVVGMHSPERGFAVLQRWFDPASWPALVQEHRLQVSTVVPSMIQMLLQQPLEEFDLTSLRYLISGAAPLAPEVVQEIERRIPGVTVREGYGCTESGAVISTNPPHRRRLGSVGQAIPGYEVRIVDELDREVPPGEIVCRAPGVMRGYWKAPELTAQVLRGGWLHTGDIGRVDRDGFLYVVDRKKDLILRGGFNVFPRDVEDALLEHPSVGAAAVVPEQLVEFVRARVGKHKYPREVHILEAVPLTPVGKVDRKALRALVSA
jgi:long-chain acyl-CoA synthetase